MRRIAWVLVVAGFVAALPSAARPAAVRSGLRAGLNAATMTWDGDREPVDVEGRRGLAGGAWVRVAPSPPPSRSGWGSSRPTSATGC